jgi:predicted transglutaminase-like cysteine proteinase
MRAQFGALFCSAMIGGCTTNVLMRDMVPAPDGERLDAGAPILAPVGLAGFCAREPGQCDQASASPPRRARADIALNRQRWRQLWDVNAAVNRTVAPLDDSAHYGVEEYWALPRDKRGDCEDYVLAKRAALRRACDRAP